MNNKLDGGVNVVIDDYLLVDILREGCISRNRSILWSFFMLKKFQIYLLIAFLILGYAHVNSRELAPGKTTYKPGESILISFSWAPGDDLD